jgi:HEAT repeat protein
MNLDIGQQDGAFLTGASRFAQRRIQRHRRLAPVADLIVRFLRHHGRGLMHSAQISRWFGFVGLSLLLFGCSRSLDKEPVYGGKPLSEWALLTQGQDIGGGPSAEARQATEAVRAIGAAKSIPFLVRWIQRPWKNSMTPGGAVQCFRIFGPEAKAAIPELAKVLGRTAKSLNDMSGQMSAAEALSYLGPDAVPVLLTAATNFHGQHIQWEVIDYMANLGTNGAAAKPAILKWSQDPDAWVRLGALHAYVAIEDNKSATVGFLLSALKDPNELVRRDAAESLGYVAQGQKDVLPALLKVLGDPDWHVRSGAVGGLGRLGAERAIVLPLLTEKLHDGNRIIRRCAAFALGDVGGKEAFDALMKSTDDPDGFVREAVFQSLKQIDADALARSGKRFY